VPKSVVFVIELLKQHLQQMIVHCYLFLQAADKRKNVGPAIAPKPYAKVTVHVCIPNVLLDCK